MIARNDFFEPIDDDELLPEASGLSDLPDDLGSNYCEPEFTSDEE